MCLARKIEREPKDVLEVLLVADEADEFPLLRLELRGRVGANK